MNPDSLDRVLRRLPSRVPPADLRTSLRVIASRERQRRLIRRAPVAYLRDRSGLFFQNVVRTFAVPAAGGVFSAILLFISFVVPSYPLLNAAKTTGRSGDVPTVLTTETSLISMGTFGESGNDVIVDVSVDNQGRMMDYVVIVGASVLAHPDTRRRLENALLVSRFVPATTFGQPMYSKVRLWFRSSRVDVKG